MIVFNEKDFLEKYRGLATFMTDGRPYYDGFLALLKQVDLLEKIKFANDVLGVPPLQAYIAYERDFCKKDSFRQPMSKTDKQGLGACFGYLYRFIYGGYIPEQCWVNDKETGIKTASCFKKV